jgi:hypothetical protein
MSLPRIALSLLLTLTFSGAPVVQALAMTASSSASHSAGLHAGHADHQKDADSTTHRHKQHNNSCMQHDSCNGSCCTNCAQCFIGVSLSLLHTDVIRPVLTPSVNRLSFSSPIALRDRPPRAFSP